MLFEWPGLREECPQRRVEQLCLLEHPLEPPDCVASIRARSHRKNPRRMLGEGALEITLPVGSVSGMHFA